MNVAILLLIWRRPVHTKKIIDSIRKVSPKKIYISSDGPIKDDIENQKLVKLTRDVVLEEINWKCDLKTNFLNVNKGCKLAVSCGISWFFDNEEEGIILEDDCLPNNDFYLFCESLLKKYKNDHRIWAVCGNGYQVNKTNKNESYFFSKYVDVWGWATWKRCWKKYDKDMRSWKSNRELFLTNNIFGNHRELNYWKKIFDNLFFNKTPDTWDYHWQYLCFINSGMVCMPYCNLVQNIGFGDGATHTTCEQTHPYFYTKKLGNIRFPLQHPTTFIMQKECDKHIQNIFYSGYPIFSRKGLIILLKKVLFKFRKIIIRINKNLREKKL